MKKDLEPFFRKKKTSKKEVTWIPQGHGFDDLIGKKCSYQAEDRNFDCQIIGFNYITEDKWPYDAYVKVHLKPLDLKGVDKNDLDEMWEGVSLASLIGIQTE
jgi:hypothetical protein